MIKLTNFSKRFLLENATTFAERNEIHALENEQAVNVDSALVSKLYKAVLDKSKVGFDTIPNSKGDVTKFEGYGSTKETLSLLEKMSTEQRVKIDDLKTIDNALKTLEMLRTPFMKGFMTNNSIVTLLYNSIVMSVLDALSHVMSSYVEFIRQPNSMEFKVIKRADDRYRVSISNLESFNEIAKNGQLNKLLSDSLKQRDNFMGGGALFVTAATVTALTLIVPLLREIIYYFYYNRMTVALYLEHQSKLLEMNKMSVERSQLSPKERKEVLKKQTQYANEINKLSEKIKVPAGSSEKDVRKTIDKENKQWTFDNVQSDVANTDSSGFTLM